MQKEVSAGVIVYRKTREGILYLLLHHKSRTDFWAPPKGKIERGESEQEAARREVGEESNITKLEFDPTFRKEMRYTYKRKETSVSKTVTWFIARTTQKDVRISYEHQGHGWFSYEDALPKLTFKNSKDILTQAHKHLTR